MTRREIAFLLIGLGAGLVLAIVAIMEIMSSWYRHMFIVALPFLLVFVGSILLRRDRSRA